MTDIDINGISVIFPFKPYEVQKDYMLKVIECLQNGKHGVLESPTGTGKTLCLLCSSLSWLLVRKAQIQAQALVNPSNTMEMNHFAKKLTTELEAAAGPHNSQKPSQDINIGWSTPRIIYASRTHSQLSQAMQELKRTNYKHVKVAVLGSRDQLCINPEVSREKNSFNKIQMCQVKVKARNCHYYNNIETRKDDPIFHREILDIEDLVKAGEKTKCCPYFLSKELKQNADITFMPYNYLLDPKSRRTQGIDLQNNVILLDEAHNVEKICEEAASLQISSTDIALCIDEVTSAMKDMSNEMSENDFLSDSPTIVPKDFTAEDLCIIKAMFLELEKAIDDIQIDDIDKGKTLPGSYIFQLLEKADLAHGKEQLVIEKLEKIIQYLSTTNTSPFARKGNALQKFNDLLRVAFVNGSPTLKYKERIAKCYKVHVQIEEQKKSLKHEGWEKKIINKNEGKLISYWCFSPGFGMEQLMNQGVRSIILTSGTLSPLKPFITELGIPIEVQLENPHIITGRQICVGVLSQGPDNFQLNSSYNTRGDPRYITSLGQTIFNFSLLIPHGLLIFFPSYPIMKKCQEQWMESGLWDKMADRKPIFVEPPSKDTFIDTMNNYYEKIRDDSNKGAIFMAVCRGKVSEGLDFADANGRAVLITGLPYPPLKDPRVILKREYLRENKLKDNNSLSGEQWYQLEASRAVNQAIGRIIRHKDDYGAIILCDCRFEAIQFKNQLSAWIRPHVKKFTGFGMIVKELKEFFRYTELSLPQPKIKNITPRDGEISLPAVSAQFNFVSESYSKAKLESPLIMEYEEDHLNLKSYRNIKTVKSDKSEDLRNVFSEAIVKPIIDFNNCKLQKRSVMSTSDLIKDIPELTGKRKKFKMMLGDFDPVPSTSASVLKNGESFKTERDFKSLEEIKNDDRRENSLINNREKGRAYLNSVKETLSREKYKVFGMMIRDYNKEGNFDKLLKTLIELFCDEDRLWPLFIGFRSFIKSIHVENFDREVKRRQVLSHYS